MTKKHSSYYRGSMSNVLLVCFPNYHGYVEDIVSEFISLSWQYNSNIFIGIYGENDLIKIIKAHDIKNVFWFMIPEITIYQKIKEEFAEIKSSFYISDYRDVNICTIQVLRLFDWLFYSQPVESLQSLIDKPINYLPQFHLVNSTPNNVAGKKCIIIDMRYDDFDVFDLARLDILIDGIKGKDGMVDIFGDDEFQKYEGYCDLCDLVFDNALISEYNTLYIVDFQYQYQAAEKYDGLGKTIYCVDMEDQEIIFKRTTRNKKIIDITQWVDHIFRAIYS